MHDLKHLTTALPALVEAAAPRQGLWLGTYPHTGHHNPVRGWLTHAIDAEAFAEQLTRHAEASPKFPYWAPAAARPTWIPALARRIQPGPKDRSSAFHHLAATPRASTPPIATAACSGIVTAIVTGCRG